MPLGSPKSVALYTLEAIEQNCRGNSEDCFTKLMTQWLQHNDPPPSWNTLKQAREEPIVRVKLIEEHPEGMYKVFKKLIHVHYIIMIYLKVVSK